MPRRKKARSRGQIQSKGLDKWLVRVYLGTDDQGKRKYSSKTVDGSKREAEQTLTEMLREIDTQTFVEPNKITVKEFVDRYLETRSDLSPSTHKGYRDAARTNVYPYIGQLRLDQLTPLMISTLYNKTLTRERGLGGRTVSQVHQLLNQAFNQAVAWGHLVKNPASTVTLPRVAHREMKTLSQAQVQLLLERTSDDSLQALWILLLTTGMRPQEALALKWSDLDAPYIYIRRALKRVTGGRWEPRETKTKRSRRKIYLPSSTVDALTKHRIAQAKLALERGASFDRDADWIFTTRDGNHLYVSFASRRWTQALKDAEIPHVRLYDCRHTQATTLLMQGVNAKVVSERLGHAGVGITLDVYSHVLPEMQEEAAGKIEQAFFNPLKAVTG